MWARRIAKSKESRRMVEALSTASNGGYAQRKATSEKKTTVI